MDGPRPRIFEYNVEAKSGEKGIEKREPKNLDSCRVTLDPGDTGFAAPLRFLGIRYDTVPLTAITAVHSRFNTPGVPSIRIVNEEISMNAIIVDSSHGLF